MRNEGENACPVANWVLPSETPPKPSVSIGGTGTALFFWGLEALQAARSEREDSARASEKQKAQEGQLPLPPPLKRPADEAHELRAVADRRSFPAGGSWSLAGATLGPCRQREAKRWERWEPRLGCRKLEPHREWLNPAGSPKADVIWGKGTKPSSEPPGGSFESVSWVLIQAPGWLEVTRPHSLPNQWCAGSFRVPVPGNCLCLCLRTFPSSLTPTMARRKSFKVGLPMAHSVF